MLFNRKQLAALEETTPGTFNTSVRSASNAQFEVIDLVATPDLQEYVRAVQRSTLTKVPPLAGQQRLGYTFKHELRGHSDGTSTPSWDRFVRACGLAKRTLYKITIGAVTGGPFRHGETITQATSGATAKVFLDTYTGTTTLYVHTITGTPDNSHVWTGGTSAATATASTTETACGFGWEPVDFPTVTVTYSGTDPAVGDIVTGGTSGAIGVIEFISTTGSGGTAKIRVHNAKMYSDAEALTATGSLGTGVSIGTASAIAQEDMPALSMAAYDDGVRVEGLGLRGSLSISGRIGEVAFLNYSFTGGFSAVADSANLSGVTTAFKIPPVLLNVGALLGTEGSTPTYVPRFNAFEFDMANQLAYRTSMAAASGILETMIADRNPRGSLDPERDLEASYPFLTNWKDNLIGSARITIGSTNGNKFIVSAPGLRASNAGFGQRDNISTYDYAFALTGGAMANVSNAAGERNELVLAYITA